MRPLLFRFALLSSLACAQVFALGADAPAQAPISPTCEEVSLDACAAGLAPHCLVIAQAGDEPPAHSEEECGLQIEAYRSCIAQIAACAPDPEPPGNEADWLDAIEAWVAAQGLAAYWPAIQVVGTVVPLAVVLWGLTIAPFIRARRRRAEADADRERDEARRRQIADLERQVAEKDAATKELLAQVLKRLGAEGDQVSPEQQRQLSETVSETADEAETGDARMKEALAALARGDLDAAEAAFEAAAEEREAAAREGASRAAEAWRRKGALAAPRSPARARIAYSRAAELEPDDAATQVALGELLVEAGELAKAEAAYQRVVALGNRTSEGERIWSSFGLGDIAVCRGDLVSALQHYKSAQKRVEQASGSDPGNAGRRRDLSASHDRIGDVLVAQGRLEEAKTAFEASLHIAKALAEADPGNAGWRRDLSVSHEKIGDVLVAQGRLEEAKTAFEASLKIREALAEADPGNAGWRRDLSVSHEKIGDVLVAQGRLEEAKTAFEASLKIREVLAEADPGNAGWRRDLAVSHERAGDILLGLSEAEGAHHHYAAALALYEALIKALPDNPEILLFSVVPRLRLGLLTKGPESVAYLRRALEILKGFSEQGRLDANRRNWISKIEQALREKEGGAAPADGAPKTRRRGFFRRLLGRKKAG